MKTRYKKRTIMNVTKCDDIGPPIMTHIRSYFVCLFYLAHIAGLNNIFIKESKKHKCRGGGAEL